MLGFVEEIVLLQLDERGRLIELPLSAADVVLAGAALMELALRNKVDTDVNRFFVVDREPTGDEILDDALAALVAGRERCDDKRRDRADHAERPPATATSR